MSEELKIAIYFSPMFLVFGWFFIYTLRDMWKTDKRWFWSYLLFIAYALTGVILI